MPRIFSVRSLSSSPPNQISLPFSNVAYQSDLLTLCLTPGKHFSITFGNVSSTTEDLMWMNRNRMIACRLFGALSARNTTLRVSRNVLPLLDPPNSITWLASLASTCCAASCFGVSFTAARLAVQPG